MNILFTNARSFYLRNQAAVLVFSILLTLSLVGVLFFVLPLNACSSAAYLLTAPILLGYRLVDYMRGRNND